MKKWFGRIGASDSEFIEVAQGLEQDQVYLDEAVEIHYESVISTSNDYLGKLLYTAWRFDQ